MKILIIGGTGNISRWFVPHLIRSGNQVTLYNRGHRKISFEGPYSTCIGDRTKYDQFEQQIRSMGRFDCVIDMAGFEPSEAEIAVKVFGGQTGQYIFCSTIDVYSKMPDSFPLKENALLGPSAAFTYAAKKQAMEKILWRANDQRLLPLTIIRPGATYSEGWSPLITCFGGQTCYLDRLLKGKEMILHGDGTAIWTATHSEDTSLAFVNAVGNPAAVHKSYNITGDELLTWQRMHIVVAEELDAPVPRFQYIPTTLLYEMSPHQARWCKDNFQYSTIVDSSEAKKDLNFTYTISFREGAARCIAALRKMGGIDSCEEMDWYDAIIDKWKRAISLMKSDDLEISQK